MPPYLKLRRGFVPKLAFAKRLARVNIVHFIGLSQPVYHVARAVAQQIMLNAAVRNGLGIAAVHLSAQLFHVVHIGGVRVAELSATFDLNDRAYEKKWLLNEVRFNDTPCDFTLIEQLIASAKAQKADIITLHAHWGWEFELYPHPKTVEYAHKLAEMGVDVIVGTHPHVSQPMEKYTYTQNGEQRSCLIFYSLGDFVSFHPQSRDSRITYVPRYTLAKGELDGRARTFVTGLQILPDCGGRSGKLRCAPAPFF